MASTILYRHGQQFAPLLAQFSARGRSQLQRQLLNRRAYSASGVEPPEYLDAGEKKVFGLLKDGLDPVKLEVQDISGGCGSTYALDIVSSKFASISLLQQHRLVKQVLGDEFKRWHGIQLKTKAP